MTQMQDLITFCGWYHYTGGYAHQVVLKQGQHHSKSAWSGRQHLQQDAWQISMQTCQCQCLIRVGLYIGCYVRTFHSLQQASAPGKAPFECQMHMRCIRQCLMVILPTVELLQPSMFSDHDTIFIGLFDIH